MSGLLRGPARIGNARSSLVGIAPSRRSPSESAPGLKHELVGGLLRQLEDDESGERDRVADHLGKGDGRTHDKDRPEDEENVLDDAGERQDERARAADQENDGNVERERRRGVADQDRQSDEVEDNPERCAALEERDEDEVESGADGCELRT